MYRGDLPTFLLAKFGDLLVYVTRLPPMKHLVN
jgi:hypothetical protein